MSILNALSALILRSGQGLSPAHWKLKRIEALEALRILIVLEAFKALTALTVLKAFMRDLEQLLWDLEH